MLPPEAIKKNTSSNGICGCINRRGLVLRVLIILIIKESSTVNELSFLTHPRLRTSRFLRIFFKLQLNIKLHHDGIAINIY